MRYRFIAPIHNFYEHPRYSLSDSIKIDSGLFIKRFKSKIADEIIKYFPELYSHHDVMDIKNCTFCVVYDFNSDVITQNDALLKIHWFVESLRLVRPTAASVSTFLYRLDESGILKPEGATQQTSKISLVIGEPADSVHFRFDDQKNIIKYGKEIIELYKKFGGEYNRVLNSFIFFQLGYLTNYAKLRIIPFVTALESLFNTSEQEIGYSLKLRCSSFLESEASAKIDLAREIKEIYDLRSSAVHGSSLPKKILRDVPRSNIILRRAEELCRNCLTKIFDEDLVGVFSQSNKKIIEYLDGRVLGL